MSFETDDLEAMKSELERVLKQNPKFGPLHRIETTEHDELALVWDDAQLRPKSKSLPGPYLAFMEEVADCLSEFGYCLAAEDDASENKKNNYLLIVPEDDEDLEDMEE